MRTRLTKQQRNLLDDVRRAMKPEDCVEMLSTLRRTVISVRVFDRS
jgi:hypothetical protein